MKRSLTCLVVLSLAICLTACSNRPDSTVQAESMPVFLSSPEPTASPAEKAPAAGPVFVAVYVPVTPEPTLAPVSTSTPAATPEPATASAATPVSETPVPTTPVPATSNPATPEPAVPTPEPHIHVWSPVTEIIHHEAVTEQVKVVDQQATEGHFEGGTYTVIVCRCGAEFTTGDAFLEHQRTAEDLGLHGGYTSSVRSDQVWVEGTPEVSHMETVIVRDAWDEEVVSGYVCSSCGAVK